MGARVLVVEDEADVRRMVRTGLGSRGYDVDVAATGAEAIERIRHGGPDVVVLDLGLPDLEGVEVIRRVRGWSRVPIVVLSARVEEQDKVKALDLGADDYLTKPFGLDELVARIRVALRHSGATEASAPVFRAGELEIDLEARRVTVGGEAVSLTPKEYDLLKALVRSSGKVLSHRALLQAAWGPEYADEDHYLHVYLGRLRKKLEADPSRPRYLLTEPGVGYRFRTADGG